MRVIRNVNQSRFRMPSQIDSFSLFKYKNLDSVDIVVDQAKDRIKIRLYHANDEMAKWLASTLSGSMRQNKVTTKSYEVL
jgi:hypothetical protein